MNRYAVGLGSNQGDRLRHLVSAVDQLRSTGRVAAVSSLYETAPVGGPEQDPFLNAVALVETDLEPIAMLDRIQAIEQAHGRTREVRWGPRTLDLDLVTSDTGPSSDARLTLPHPLAAERGFVLRPLCDVWPQAPVGEKTAAEALGATGDDGVDHLARRWEPDTNPWPGRLLVIGQFVLLIVAAVALAGDGSLPEGRVTVQGVLGAALAFLGMIMAFVASRRLGPAMTASPAPKEGALLVMAGPFRYVRHPMYGGVTLVLVGTALFLDSLWGAIAAVAMGAFFWFKSTYEERRLRMEFAGYRAYRAVVHRRLIPFIL